MSRMKLTNTVVERLTFPAGATTETGKPLTQAVFWDTEVKGLGVRVSADGKTKAYVFQFRVKGSKQERNVTLGRHNDPLRIDQARAKALELKAQMVGGVETRSPRPSASRRQASGRAMLDKALATNLRDVMEHYLLHRRTKHGPLRPATQKDIRRHCEVNLANWLDEPVATITRDRCLARFTELTARAPQHANACMVYLRALLNHAREMHATDDGQFPVLAVNPVSRLWKLKKPNPEKPKETRISLNKIGACWQAVSASLAPQIQARRYAGPCASLRLASSCHRGRRSRAR